MMKKFACLFTALAIIFSANSTLAAEYSNIQPYASNYLDSYGLVLVADGNTAMSISYVVHGVTKMDKLGVQKMTIQERTSTGWSDYLVYTGGGNQDFYSYNAYDHTGDVIFYGTPGKYYRAIMVVYAEKNGGYDTGTITCTEKLCK